MAHETASVLAYSDITSAARVVTLLAVRSPAPLLLELGERGPPPLPPSFHHHAIRPPHPPETRPPPRYSLLNNPRRFHATTHCARFLSPSPERIQLTKHARPVTTLSSLLCPYHTSSRCTNQSPDN